MSDFFFSRRFLPFPVVSLFSRHYIEKMIPVAGFEMILPGSMAGGITFTGMEGIMKC